jgi:simple sugar transport system substrate-binding protein
MVFLDSVNSAARPETTLDQVVEDMVNQGAKLILTTSADFEVDTTVVAAQYPDITFINISGDDALWGLAPANAGNFMGQMEYGKMMAGCAAALKTESGSIGYIGPLIDPETTRLSRLSGREDCYENYAVWTPPVRSNMIGRFNIPGVTLT